MRSIFKICMQYIHKIHSNMAHGSRPTQTQLFQTLACNNFTVTYLYLIIRITFRGMHELKMVIHIRIHIN